MNLISILARGLVAAAAILGLASCMSYEPPLRIALIRWPPFEFLHLAQEKGYFADEGVETMSVFVRFFRSSTATCRLVPMPAEA